MHLYRQKPVASGRSRKPWEWTSRWIASTLSFMDGTLCLASVMCIPPDGKPYGRYEPLGEAELSHSRLLPITSQWLGSPGLSKPNAFILVVYQVHQSLDAKRLISKLGQGQYFPWKDVHFVVSEANRIRATLPRFYRTYENWISDWYRSFNPW